MNMYVAGCQCETTVISTLHLVRRISIEVGLCGTNPDTPYDLKAPASRKRAYCAPGETNVPLQFQHTYLKRFLTGTTNKNTL